MKAFHIITIAFLLFNSSGLLAQEENAFKDKIIRLDSVEQQKIPSKIHAGQLDSLRSVWRPEEEKRMKIAGEEFMAGFNKLPDSLTALNMSRLGLTEMPDISRFTKLEKLYADGNQFTRIPKSTFSSDSLRYVDLSGNPLKRLQIPRQNTVVSIKMETCALKRIPFSIRKMKGLKKLYINNLSVSIFYQNNNIEKIPGFIKRLEDLSEIDLNYNSINLNKSSINRLQKISVISLVGNKLTSVPENIDQLLAVKRINLSKNQLSGFPPSWANLDSLEVLILYDNNFNKIPAEVLQLKNLIELDLYYNSIDEIPEEICQLQELERLYLSYNNIHFLPDTMQYLKNLRRLYIHHNQLTILPSWITQLSQLEILHVGSNQLIEFPDVSGMPNLYEVDIQNNAIGKIPWKLIKKKNLKLLLMKNNLFLEDKDTQQELKQLQQLRINECVISID